mmetsp:Transcript_7670/g.9782  ORF Transcript_7670/g.9782 Transcript_7670/m.9782 type:complete len:265 (-) Transcript_7670:60-854(-)
MMIHLLQYIIPMIKEMQHGKNNILQKKSIFNENNPADDNDNGDDEFPSLVLESTVSLIDPREEIFDDDPFATVYNPNDSSHMDSLEEEEEKEEEEEDLTLDDDEEDEEELIIGLECLHNNGIDNNNNKDDNTHPKATDRKTMLSHDDNQIAVNNNNNAWIPQLMKRGKKTNVEESLNQSTMNHFSRLFGFGNNDNKNVNHSFRTTTDQKQQPHQRQRQHPKHQPQQQHQQDVNITKDESIISTRTSVTLPAVISRPGLFRPFGR